MRAFQNISKIFPIFPESAGRNDEFFPTKKKIQNLSAHTKECKVTSKCDHMPYWGSAQP